MEIEELIAQHVTTSKTKLTKITTITKVLGQYLPHGSSRALKLALQASFEAYDGKVKDKKGTILHYKNLLQVTIDGEYDYQMVDHQQRITENKKTKLVKITGTVAIIKMLDYGCLAKLVDENGEFATVYFDYAAHSTTVFIEKVSLGDNITVYCNDTKYGNFKATKYCYLNDPDQEVQQRVLTHYATKYHWSAAAPVKKQIKPAPITMHYHNHNHNYEQKEVTINGKRS